MPMIPPSVYLRSISARNRKLTKTPASKRTKIQRGRQTLQRNPLPGTAGHEQIDGIEKAQRGRNKWSYDNDGPNIGLGGITPAMKLKQTELAAVSKIGESHRQQKNGKLPSTISNQRHHAIEKRSKDRRFYN